MREMLTKIPLPAAEKGAVSVNLDDRVSHLVEGYLQSVHPQTPKEWFGMCTYIEALFKEELELDAALKQINTQRIAPKETDGDFKKIIATFSVQYKEQRIPVCITQTAESRFAFGVDTNFAGYESFLAELYPPPEDSWYEKTEVITRPSLDE